MSFGMQYQLWWIALQSASSVVGTPFLDHGKCNGGTNATECKLRLCRIPALECEIGSSMYALEPGWNSGGTHA